jgi:hypothetical protein
LTVPPVTPDRVIYLDLKRRRKAERASSMMDLVAALTLLFTAVPVIAGSPTTVSFAYLEAAAGAGLLLSILRELKKKSESHRSVVGWTEVFSSVILMMDSVRKFEHGPRHYPLATAYAALSIFVLAKGQFHARIAQSRHFRFNDEGVSGRSGWFTKFHVRWNDLAGITATLDSILFRQKDGGVTRVDLAGLHNAREVSDEIVARAISKGIGVRAASVNDCALPGS